MSDAERPQRVRLPDFSGRMWSLPDEPESWICWGEGDAALLLGLGPGDPHHLPFLKETPTVYWLDSERTRMALRKTKQSPEACTKVLLDDPVEQHEEFPAHWYEISFHQAIALAPTCRCYLYVPGVRLDPNFWGPLLGHMDAALFDAACRKNRGNCGEPAPMTDIPKPGEADCRKLMCARTGGRSSTAGRGAVLLPGSDSQLLHQELRQALEWCGFGPVFEDIPCLRQNGNNGCVTGNHKASFQQDNFVSRWAGCLSGGKPAFLLSVNGRGLDSEGRVFHFCQALGIRVVLWFVDNPWHVLSNVRLPWWCEADIFVTDAGFIDSLTRMGAKRAFHLPLAVAPHMWSEQASPLRKSDVPLFVGRSSFPGKERFFSAARVPQTVSDEATKLLQSSSGPKDAPHFFWWQARLGGDLWPGNDVRRIGLGAECSAQANRARWLLAAGAGDPEALRIVGDNGWKMLLPNANLLPPVDYYTVLPHWYANAGAVLNVTSLLMPQSLSQRHFDVWACGGFLLSDATAGLDIFPKELTEPIILGKPEDFPVRFEWLRGHPHEALDLRRAWRAHLRAFHGYEHRIRQIDETLHCNLPS